MSYTEVTHVLFDLDGLLLDTEGSHEKVISEIAGRYGKEYTHDVKMKLLGTTEQDTARLAISEMNLPITIQEFRNQYSILCRTAFTNSPFMRGAVRLIKHLHKNKIPFALATSSSNETAELKLRGHPEIFSLFSHKVMGTTDPEVKKGKPHPDIFLVCASRFPDKPDPAKCLVFEDAPNGARAAVSAGMQVVMVPDPCTDRALCSHATLVINSLDEFHPELFGLPPTVKTTIPMGLKGAAIPARHVQKGARQLL